MRIEIDGKFAIDRAYEGFVIQRYDPPHQTTRDSRSHKKGDMIPGKWKDDCYTNSIDHALHIVLDDAVMLSPEVVTDLRAAIREWHRIESAILRACDSVGGDLEAKMTTG